jgi:DNA-binding transcriptional ArsR family regulator
VDSFKVLGNKNRARLLKALSTKEMHISGLAKELNISVPVTLRHVKILEEAGFIERKKLGNSHVLKLKDSAFEKLKKAWSLFEEQQTISVKKGTILLDALKKIPGIKIEEKKDNAFITEVDGKKGFFVYEINGKLPNAPINKFVLEKDSELELKQLLPVVGKKAIIKIE